MSQILVIRGGSESPLRVFENAVFAPLLQVPPASRGEPNRFGSPCLQGEPKGGGEKFRLFSNTLTSPLDF
jgi:hypothetical protein